MAYFYLLVEIKRLNILFDYSYSMTETDKRLTAIVTAEQQKSELQDDITSLDADIRVESDLPFSSIVVSVNDKNNLEQISDLDSVKTIDIEGSGSVPTFDLL